MHEILSVKKAGVVNSFCHSQKSVNTILTNVSAAARMEVKLSLLEK